MIETIINDINYRLDEDNLTAEVIRRKGVEYEGNIIIPETTVFNDVTYRVTSIGEHAFTNCSSLTSIVIPDSVTKIEAGTFKFCRRLTSIVIPDSVTIIGRYAFENCTSLTSIVIPNTVTHIGEGAFSDCAKLERVIVREGVTDIAIKAFYHSSALVDMSLPASLTSIGEDAFAYTAIKKITFGGSIREWKQMNTKKSGSEITVVCANGSTSSYR